MKLNEVVGEVMSKKWTKVNNFSAEFNIVDSGFRSLVGWDISTDEFNISLKSVDTPQYSNNPIEYFTGNEWRFNNGRDDLFKFGMTFRDYNQMNMYSKFVNMYNKSKDNYFDKIKIEISIYLDSDVDTSRTLLLTAGDCIIESISQVQFDHTTENQIAEFSVNFKCSSPIHKGITKAVGSDSRSGAVSSLSDTSTGSLVSKEQGYGYKETAAEQAARVAEQAQSERDLQYNVSDDGELTLKDGV